MTMIYCPVSGLDDPISFVVITTSNLLRVIHEINCSLWVIVGHTRENEQGDCSDNILGIYSTSFLAIGAAKHIQYKARQPIKFEWDFDAYLAADLPDYQQIFIYPFYLNIPPDQWRFDELIKGAVEDSFRIGEWKSEYAKMYWGTAPLTQEAK